MASIFAHEYFPDCGCCACQRGSLEVEARGGTFYRLGYTALNGDTSLGLYSTKVSRGWGGYGLLTGNMLAGPTENDSACTYDPPFAGEGEGTDGTFAGTMLSRLWITGAGFPWPDDVNAGTPDVEITDCVDGIIPFATADDDEPTQQQAYSLDYPDYVPPGPRGQTNLLNLQDVDDVFQRLRTVVDASSWPGTTAPTHPDPATTGRVYIMHRPALSTTSSLFMSHERVRFRQRFKIPASGVFRLEIDIWFIPFVLTSSIPPDYGTKVLYDTISWQWDETVPSGYDEADPETWPVTPWFDMPDFDSAVGYGDFLTEYDDTRVFCSTAIAAEAPADATVEQIP